MTDLTEAWIDENAQLAKKLLALRSDKDGVDAAMKKACDGTGLKFKLSLIYKHERHMDPFSVFSAFCSTASGGSDERAEIRERVFGTFLGVRPSDCPLWLPLRDDDFPFFQGADVTNGVDEAEALWRLFASAVGRGASFAADYDRVKPFEYARKNYKTYNSRKGFSLLATALFWIAPRDFVPLDEGTLAFICSPNALPAQFRAKIAPLAAKLDITAMGLSGAEYSRLCAELKAQLSQGLCGCKSIPEFVEYVFRHPAKPLPKPNARAVKQAPAPAPVSETRRAAPVERPAVQERKAAPIGQRGTNLADDAIVKKRAAQQQEKGAADKRGARNDINMSKPATLPRNRLELGATGTGKSGRLKKDAAVFGKNVDRVAFRAGSTHEWFFGSVRQPRDGAKFVPGPFMSVYAEALKRPRERHLLIIEDIDRADAADVFGCVLQLMERDAHGGSEFPITAPPEVRDFLIAAAGKNEDGYRYLSIPANMYIWATGGGAGSASRPLDPAFLRRWKDAPAKKDEEDDK